MIAMDNFRATHEDLHMLALRGIGGVRQHCDANLVLVSCLRLAQAKLTCLLLASRDRGGDEGIHCFAGASRGLAMCS